MNGDVRSIIVKKDLEMSSCKGRSGEEIRTSEVKIMLTFLLTTRSNQ